MRNKVFFDPVSRLQARKICNWQKLNFPLADGRVVSDERGSSFFFLSLEWPRKERKRNREENRGEERTEVSLKRKRFFFLSFFLSFTRFCLFFLFSVCHLLSRSGSGTPFRHDFKEQGRRKKDQGVNRGETCRLDAAAVRLLC